MVERIGNESYDQDRCPIRIEIKILSSQSLQQSQPRWQLFGVRHNSYITPKEKNKAIPIFLDLQDSRNTCWLPILHQV
jgi:hypothetical protein